MAPNLKRIRELVKQGAPPSVAIRIADREAAAQKKSATSPTSASSAAPSSTLRAAATAEGLESGGSWTSVSTNLTSNGRPRDPRLLECLAKQERRRKCRAGVDREDIVTMVGILRAYIDDGVVEFERAWRLFRAEHPQLAARLERPFELAWRKLRGEERRVADVENLHQEIAGLGSDQSTEHPGKGMKLWQVATLFEHFSENLHQEIVGSRSDQSTEHPDKGAVISRTPMEPLFAIYHTSNGRLPDARRSMRLRARLRRRFRLRINRQQQRQALQVGLLFLLLL